MRPLTVWQGRNLVFSSSYQCSIPPSSHVALFNSTCPLPHCEFQLSSDAPVRSLSYALDLLNSGSEYHISMLVYLSSYYLE